MKAWGADGSLGTLMQVEQDDIEEQEQDTEELLDRDRDWGGVGM